MKKFLLAAVGALTLYVAPNAFACGEGKAQTITLEDSGKLSKEKKATFVDANNQETRTKFGVIPGAVLLTNYAEFDAAKELPAKKDAKLIFYCANTHCGASQEAATRAMEAGYKDVSVLPDGIMGWSKAGLPVDKKLAAKRNS